MHKWKLFKKSAALVLSSAVIASGVPVTAMASEAEVFSDVSGETQGETAQEEGENEDQESQKFQQKRFNRKRNRRSRRIQKRHSVMEKHLWQKQARFFRMLLRSLLQE